MPVELLLATLPWILVVLYLVVYFRSPATLRESIPGDPEGEPLVSVIVPARNEEDNIGACLESLAGSDYAAVEIIVVDDQSEDRTPEIVRRHSNRAAHDVRLVTGEPLPAGWFGKPWACWQGAREARGELLLFTDADTRHGPRLLGNAVRDLEDSAADVLTLVGRQVMGSFWEQLLQPQFFLLLAGRYPRTRTPKPPHRWKNAIANGQYLLFRRGAYEGIGGHRVVASEVVEDLRFAQLLVRAGRRLVVRQTEDLTTRMYQSLPGIVEGWSKNVATAALQTTTSWLLPVILPLAFVVGFTLWLLPPLCLAWSLVAGMRGTLLVWSFLATFLNTLVWARASAMMKGNPLFGLIYPLGSVVSLFIFVKSWWRGGAIVWKGRTYGSDSEPGSQPPDPRLREE
jgi:chlorobactene glucosyltransferase